MKTLALLLSALLLAACAAPGQVPTSPDALPTAELPEATLQVASTSEPAGELVTFDPATYEDPLGRFTFDYPVTWQLIGGEGGERGGYFQIASWPAGVSGENIPPGETLLQVAIYQWDPKSDLPARVEMRRTAFNNSGMVIAEENEITLPAGGPSVVRMHLVQNGVETRVYFFVLGDEYLEISGAGDLKYLDAIIDTFEYGPN